MESSLDCDIKKVPQTLVNTEFTVLFPDERAGIRTPDNLIKSHGPKMPTSSLITSNVSNQFETHLRHYVFYLKW